MQKINTTRFGEIEIDEKKAVHFPDGLLGFPDRKNYIIMEHKPGSPFLWLQSIDSPDLAFVMTNPFLLDSGYLKNLSKDEDALLKNENDDEILVFSLVTIPKGMIEAATANLMGPIIVESTSRNAKQVILANSGYSHRHPLIIK
jgi:flagellar assembly factor FliW